MLVQLLTKQSMKKRRTLIISLLLVAALALGIGYAGFTSELMINGDAVMNSTTTSQVVIESVDIDQKNGEIQLTTQDIEKIKLITETYGR